MNLQSILTYLQQQYNGVPGWVWLMGLGFVLLVAYRIYTFIRRISFILRLVMIFAGVGAYGGVSSCSRWLHPSQPPGANGQTTTGQDTSGPGTETTGTDSIWPK